MKKSNCSLCGESQEELAISIVKKGQDTLNFKLCETCLQSLLSQLKIPALLKPMAEGLPQLNRDYDSMIKRIGDDNDSED